MPAVKLSARHARVHAPRLGELEIAVMELAWSRPALSAQEAHAALEARGITLSTVQSTLERLTRKGLLARSKAGRAFRYRAVVAREALIASLLRALSDELATGRLEPVLDGLATLLDELGTERAASLRARLGNRGNS